MAQKPDKFPDWATDDVVDPVSGVNNAVEPPDSKKDIGWSRREKPPRQWWNWLQRKTGEWLRYLDEYLDETREIADELDENALRSANNLADVADAPESRDNLGLGNGATLDVADEAESIAGASDSLLATPLGVRQFVESFADEYGFGENAISVSTADLDDLIDQGKYILRGGWTSGPVIPSVYSNSSPVVGAALLDVYRDGAGIVQSFRSVISASGDQRNVSMIRTSPDGVSFDAWRNDSAVGAAISGHGGVGTFALARLDFSAFNATITPSITWMGFGGETSGGGVQVFPTVGGQFLSPANVAGAATLGPTNQLPGGWRCVGYCNSSNNETATTLWLRVS